MPEFVDGLPFATDTAPSNFRPNPSPREQEDIAGQWRSWIDNPGNRAALMQFGIAALQPVGLGQTPLGHLGNAIGAGAEASARVGDAALIETE